MPLPVCVACRQEMRPTDVGVAVQHGLSPSLSYYGDLFQCRGCGLQVVTGFGTRVDLAADEKPIVYR